MADEVIEVSHFYVAASEENQAGILVVERGMTADRITISLRNLNQPPAPEDLFLAPLSIRDE